jgi:hypothetical protein
VRFCSRSGTWHNRVHPSMWTAEFTLWNRQFPFIWVNGIGRRLKDTVDDNKWYESNLNAKQSV